MRRFLLGNFFLGAEDPQNSLTRFVGKGQPDKTLSEVLRSRRQNLLANPRRNDWQFNMG